MNIINGGQTVVDIAGLKVAKNMDLLLAVTLDGLKPEYIELYGMKETTSTPLVTKATNYPTRTM